MPAYKRVKDKSTGHEYSLVASKFDPEKYTEVDKPATNSAGDPLGPKHRTSVSKEAARNNKTGQRAEPEKEKD